MTDTYTDTYVSIDTNIDANSSTAVFFNREKNAEDGEPVSLPPENHTFEIRVDTNPRQVKKNFQPVTVVMIFIW